MQYLLKWLLYSSSFDWENELENEVYGKECMWTRIGNNKNKVMKLKIGIKKKKN